ncbi:G-protein coupled receptor Mth-like [Cloeon dipterum]|uniref:G-protein coupled receptor Mth-like n=1 Tax=Cloeon dipterum TaxID=197152 RepID=UPI0032209193
MKSSIFTLLLVLRLAFGKDLCKEELRTSLEGAVLLKNGSLLTGEGDNYPEGTFWKDEAESWHWWVCPCLLAPCIRICDTEIVDEIIEAYRETEPNLPFLWDEIIETGTPPIESFKQLINAKCDRYHDILNKEDVMILTSGKMRLKNKTKLYGAENYCVHQMEGINSIHLVRCLSNLEEESKEKTLPKEFYENTYISWSIFFIFVVVAGTFSPEIKSIFGEGMLCFLACLLVACVTLSVNSYIFQTGKFDQISIQVELCISIGFILLYSYLASFFWLNTMCIEIFLTYKGIISTGKNYFSKFAIYSFGGPLVIVAVALYFNLINDENSIFNPNIGNGLCTINGKAPMLLYFHGPILILLVANVGLLSATWASGEPVQTTEETDQTVWKIKFRIFYLAITLLEIFFRIRGAIA